MGATRYDKEAAIKRLESRYVLNTTKGVEKILKDIYHLRSSAFTRSDFAAIDLLLDLCTAIEKANLSKRQRETLYYLYILGYSQRETAAILGVDEPVISIPKTAALRKIAKVFDEWGYS